MGIGFSIFLFAVGAIVRYAITYRLAGVDLPTVGLILMIVGAVGLLASLIWAALASSRTERRVIVRDRDIHHPTV